MPGMPMPPPGSMPPPGLMPPGAMPPPPGSMPPPPPGSMPPPPMDLDDDGLVSIILTLTLVRSRPDFVQAVHDTDWEDDADQPKQKAYDIGGVIEGQNASVKKSSGG
ncbi:hypothetical protein PENSPDRAFT_682420 [Peniophora sp. CONT]|nr:hypothetical protein PENSPDRAFT_682420 [Peniophora sp. CONT]